MIFWTSGPMRKCRKWWMCGSACSQRIPFSPMGALVQNPDISEALEDMHWTHKGAMLKDRMNYFPYIRC
jgi:hypothetical protein